MALELGLKFTKASRAPDNATSVSELRISKNTASPVFVSTESRSSFILTCYLKGYDRNSFQIKISENGKEISIRGEKPIQELLMMGRVMLNKNVQIVGFKKVFEIPNGVVLDRIKAKFDEDESLLKIVMTKLVKGICGVQIEEVKKEEFGESSQKASSETRENECVCRKEEGLSDEKLVESSNGDVIEGPRFEAMKESEIGEVEFGNGGKDEEEMSKKGFEAVERSKEEEESKKVFAGKIEEPKYEAESDKKLVESSNGDVIEGPRFEAMKESEIGEVEFGNGGKDEEEMSKKGFEAVERSKEEEESKKVFAGKIEEPKYEEESDKKLVESSNGDVIEGPRFEAMKESEIGEVEFGNGGKDEEEMSKKGFEAVERSKEEEESKKMFAGKIEEPKYEEESDKKLVESSNVDVIEGPRFEATKESEIGEVEFGNGGKDEEEMSKKGFEAVERSKEEEESKKVFAGKIEETKYEEESDKKLVESSNGDVIEGPRFEAMKESEIGEVEFGNGGKDEEEMSKKGFEAIERSKEEEESKKVFAGKIEEPKYEEESDKKLVESSNGDVIEGPRFEAMKESEIGEVKFGNGGKDEKEMSKKGFEAVERSKEEEESKKVFAGKIEEPKYEEESDKKLVESSNADVIEGPRFQATKESEIGEVEFGNGGKDEEEMSKKGFEAVERSKEEEESKKVFAGKIEELKSEAEDRGERRGETKETKFECEGKDKERVSKGGLEAIDTTKEERESEDVLAGAMRDDEEGRIDKNKRREVEEAKLETEGKDEEMEGGETTTKEAIETRMEGVRPKKVHGEKMEVSKDGIEQKEIEDEDRERESEAAKFEIKGKDGARVGTATNKKGLEATESKIGEIGVSEEDRVEGTEQRETEETKFEIEDREKVEQVLRGTHEKEIKNNEFAVEGGDEERMGPKIMEEVETKGATIEGGVSEKLFSDASGVSEKDIVDWTKKREIGENEQVLKEEISKEDFEARKTKIKEPKIPECATSKGQNLEEIEETTTEAEGILEGAAGEEPKMSKEASKVDGNDYASDSGKREIEESAIRSSRDGHVQEVFEELGTDTSKFPIQMSETKAQGEKEVKVREEIIVEREKEVKVKEEIIVNREKEVRVKEVIVNKYDEAKEGFDKATTVGKIQLETGQPSDGRGFDNETSEAAKWDKTKACEEGYVEAGPFMEDNKRERTQKETEDPRVETKHKAQHRVQELPKKIAESTDEREGPKDTEIGEMKEAKRKSEETQVVANEESTIEKKIPEAEFERISQTNQCEKSLQEVPEAKDREESSRDMREREIMKPTQHSEVQETDKVCEESKRSAANLEREKWRTTRSVKDEKPRREHAVKHLEDKVPYPELRKEEVEGARLKELPPPKVRVQSLDSPESEKKNMKWKSPKTKKLAPEATEGEEYEAGKPPEVQSSSSSQQSMVDKEMSEIEIPESSTSGTPSEEKEIEHFKTLTEDRGHYLLDTEKRLEAKKVAEEEKLNQRDEEETLPCKREMTKIAECKDEESKTKRNGSEEINQIKPAAEEFRDVLADNGTGKSQEILSPQTAEIQGKEKISEIRQVQQEKRREIPFQANEESEAVISNREAEPQKPNDAHPKESTIKFDSDKPKGEVDNGRHLEFQEPEKQESELDFQESTRRKPDQEVEKTHFSQQEENHEGRAIEEEKVGEEAENVAHVEISQESQDLEDIEVEANGKKVKLYVPMVFAGSVFIASVIIFFFGRKGAQKR